MHFKAILGGLLKTAYKLEQPEIDSLLDESKTQDEVQASLLVKDATRIQPFLQKFEEGQKKGTKDYATKLETAAKTKYGLESDLTGLELIDAIVAAKADVKTDEEKVKLSPLFLQKENELKQEKADRLKEVQDLQNGFKKKETFSAILTNNIYPEVEKAKLVLPEHQGLAGLARQAFESELAGYDFEPQANGSPLVMKDGKRVDDAHGNAIPLESLVAQVGQKYFIQANNSGAASPENGQRQNNGSGNGAKKFKDKAEFEKYLQDPSVSNVDKDAALKDFYKAE